MYNDCRNSSIILDEIVDKYILKRGRKTANNLIRKQIYLFTIFYHTLSQLLEYLKHCHFKFIEFNNF